MATALADEESIGVPAIISKKKQLLSSSLKRTSEWILSQDIPSDLTVHVGDAILNLHKLPLISKSGYIHQLISKPTTDSKIKTIDIKSIPGGIEGFEFAVKFCYGVHFEITIENVALLRCVAEFLEMTEEYAADNLITRTEFFLQEVALTQITSAITVLHKSETLLPVAERVKLISRCIDSIAYMTCKDQQLSQSPLNDANRNSSGFNPKPIVDWWADELTVLRIDIFQRVLVAMKARGFKEQAFGPLVMLYAQKSLRSLDIYGRAKKKIDPKQEHEKRIILETIVSLLPRERNSMSVSFLSMLLRASIYLDTTVACRLDLEKRMALQLGQAVLDDLLIPSFSEDEVFDVDTVKRILTNYIEHEGDGSRLDYATDDDLISLPPTDAAQVGRLMESYLAEIATDPNLNIEKFIVLGELVPEQARFNEDGMYRAIDIYLKAHPTLGDVDRKRVCRLMDSQKLSREACAHAAQNDRLPAQTVVQVLYSEQQRLRDSSMYSSSFMGGDSPAVSYQGTPVVSGVRYQSQSTNEVSRLQRENDELKMELFKMKMKLKESSGPLVYKETQASSTNAPRSADKPPLPKKSFINSVSKTLGKINLFLRSDSVGTTKARAKPPKDRRHSIS
ncbi:hypothetical protein LUZ63_018375 [Rhynchospora breviuscula]|uniref:Uncharacterized protein n=1 Tax=Rhynchospora breviuscula TaxID=2022672 RepID=A0A9Q0HIK8_9POAL|nr:hypothetical protein LUZ63_018375 [Rhynchospora breviuscula]